MFVMDENREYNRVDGNRNYGEGTRTETNWYLLVLHDRLKTTVTTLMSLSYHACCLLLLSFSMHTFKNKLSDMTYNCP